MNKRAQSLDASKKKVIALSVIGILVVVVLVAVFYFGVKGPTAGRAIFTGEDAAIVQGDAGFSGTMDPLLGQIDFDFVVGAILGNEQSVAYSFQLQYPDTLEFVSISTPRDDAWRMGGEEFRRLTNENNVLTFEHATLNLNAKLTDNVENLATVRFHVKEGTLTKVQFKAITFSDIQVLSLADNENIIVQNRIKQPSDEEALAVPVVDPVPAPAGGQDCSIFANCEGTCNANKASLCAGMINRADCPVPVGCPAGLPGARGQLVKDVTDLLQDKGEQITPEQKVQLIAQLGVHLNTYFTQAVAEAPE
ncbi:hypothetical protein J4420_06050 [Candidatus Woesearchaeota archaeon]|nr:hypothetical protein [Candidatus Woesearchaeota archaeon]